MDSEVTSWENVVNTSFPLRMLLIFPIKFVSFLEKIERTVQIEASTVEIEERGVKLRLTVVDTPGYGDAINCRDWYAPGCPGICICLFNVLKFIDSVNE